MLINWFIFPAVGDERASFEEVADTPNPPEPQIKSIVDEVRRPPAESPAAQSGPLLLFPAAMHFVAPTSPCFKCLALGVFANLSAFAGIFHLFRSPTSCAYRVLLNQLLRLHCHL